MSVRAARLALFLVVVGAAFIGAPFASAHTTLERSEPPNGGMVAVGRSGLTVWFSEPVSVRASVFTLRNADGKPVAVTVAGAAGNDGSRAVKIGTPALARAGYVLRWAAVSLEDGHLSSGTVTFGVGVRPLVSASTGTDLPGISVVVLRWIDLVAIMLAIGALAVSFRVLQQMGSIGNSAGRRARTIAWVAAGCAVITGAITPVVRTPRSGGPLLEWLDVIRGTLTGTTWGHVWVARELAMVIVVISLWLWATRKSGARWAAVGGAALVAAIGFEAWAGHASTLPRQSELVVLASGLHLAAAGVWAGGLAVLAVCVIPVMRRNPDARSTILASVWRSFSPVAAVATVILLATGLYESGRNIPGLGAFGSTVYGNAVAAKVALLVLALVLASLNAALVNPWVAGRVQWVLGRPVGWAPISARRFPVVVFAEIAVIVIAVGAAAVLTSVPTPREIAAANVETAPHVVNVDGLFVTFEEIPAGTDRTQLVVRTHSTVKPDPGPVRGVDVTLAGPIGATSPLPLKRVEPGRYEGETDALTAGTWSGSVAIHRDGVPDAVTEARWYIPKPEGEAVRPLESLTTTLAVLLLAAVAGAIGLFRFRRAPPAAKVFLTEKKPERIR